MSMPFLRTRYSPIPYKIPFCLLLLTSIVLYSFTVWAQDSTDEDKEDATTGSVLEIESELTKAEQGVAQRLEQLEDLQLLRNNLKKAIETDKAGLTEAESAGDGSRIKAAEESLQMHEETAAALVRKLRTIQLLYDQAVENYRIASERQRLYRDREKAGPGEQGGTLLLDSARRKAEVKFAVRELELSQKEVTVLEQKETILKTRAEVISRELMDAEQRLKEDKFPTLIRRSIERRRHQILEEQKAIQTQIAETRNKLVRARAQQRILAERVKQKSAGFTEWWTNIIQSAVLMIAAVLMLFVLRLVVGRRIKDAQRRYYLNRSLSILTVFVIIVGLLVIFVRDPARLATGLGVAVAGLAIALQELISSFFAWFIIQGSRGYRVGDWIRIGDQYGEVLDISLMVTTLGQVTAIDSRGESGGGWTGGLTIFPNSTIFKQPIVNFTRGYPFIWCSLAYTFTYESDWKQAETLLMDAVREKEITSTAQQARKHIEEMTKDYAIRVRRTEPVVRSRPAASGIELTLRFLAHPRRRRLLMDQVNRLVLEAVNISDHVDFAYQTIRTIPSSPDDTRIIK